MASREYWEVDPFDLPAMWQKVVGHDQEFPDETKEAALRIFDSYFNCCDVRCLEIGAGVGRLLIPALNHFYKAYGVDSSVSLVAMSTRYLQDSHCRVILNDGLTLPFPDKAFSFVYSFTCFQHMETIEIIRQNIREALRVLKPNGICKVQTVCGNPDASLYDGLVFPSGMDFANEFLNAGFESADWKIEDSWIWVTAKKGAS